MFRLMLFGGAFAIGLSHCAVAQSPSVAEGAKLFAKNCAICHRADGSGGRSFGAVTSADLRSPGLEQTYRFDDRLILRAILSGLDQDGEKLNAPMPVWKNRLSTGDAEAIIAYLHTLHS
jgi:mono/diheme cytochrome c family protein